MKKELVLEDAITIESQKVLFVGVSTFHELKSLSDYFGKALIYLNDKDDQGFFMDQEMFEFQGQDVDLDYLAKKLGTTTQQLEEHRIWCFWS